MARTLIARLPRLFGSRSWVSRKNPIPADIIIFGTNKVEFRFILIMMCYVYSLESPHRGDSNENKHHTFMFKNIEKGNIRHAA